MTTPTRTQTSYVKSLLSSPSHHQSTHAIGTIKSTLKLQDHPEGGYFVETDRDPLKIPNPFLNTPIYTHATSKALASEDGTDATPTRNASTSIFYYLDPLRPNGVFHRNKGRTVHTLHWGRGIYVLIHADEVNSTPPSSSASTVSNKRKARIETFTVGPDIAAGEKLQWVVEGGKFKASFLIPDEGMEDSQRGLLISETVVPGFEYMDHDFLTFDGLRELVGDKEFEELKWLLKST